MGIAIVGQRFRGPDLVTANASIGLLWGLGGLTGPLIGGAAMDVWDPEGLPGVIVGATLAFLALAAWSRLRLPPGVRAPRHRAPR